MLPQCQKLTSKNLYTDFNKTITKLNQAYFQPLRDYTACTNAHTNRQKLYVVQNLCFSSVPSVGDIDFCSIMLNVQTALYDFIIYIDVPIYQLRQYYFLYNKVFVISLQVVWVSSSCLMMDLCIFYRWSQLSNNRMQEPLSDSQTSAHQGFSIFKQNLLLSTLHWTHNKIGE